MLLSPSGHALHVSSKWMEIQETKFPSLRLDITPSLTSKYRYASVCSLVHNTQSYTHLLCFQGFVSRYWGILVSSTAGRKNKNEHLSACLSICISICVHVFVSVHVCMLVCACGYTTLGTAWPSGLNLRADSSSSSTLSLTIHAICHHHLTPQ